jgi:hypothetical protein
MRHDDSTGRAIVLTRLVFAEVQWKLRACMPVRKGSKEGIEKFFSLVPFHLKERGEILRV